jgi:serine/threonine protein kinase
VWSIACLLYECGSGRVPFKGNNALELLDDIFFIVGSPTRETWPEAFLLSSKIPKKTTGLSGYFNTNVLLCDKYKEIMSKAFVVNPDKRPTASVLLDILK